MMIRRSFNPAVTSRTRLPSVRRLSRSTGRHRLKVQNGPNSGQAIVRGKPVLKAVSYTVRSAPIGSNGKPRAWTELLPIKPPSSARAGEGSVLF
jgi:hypothetical protein